MDMDDLLKELEQSVQDEIQQHKVESPNKPVEVKKPVNFVQNEGFNHPQASSKSDYHLKKSIDARKRSVEVDEAIEANIDSNLFVSPAIQSFGDSSIKSESEPEVALKAQSPFQSVPKPLPNLLLNVIDSFPRAASTTSLREETEELILENVDNSDANNVIDFVNPNNLKLSKDQLEIKPGPRNSGLNSSNLARSPSISSILDQGEDDEDALVKSLVELDEDFIVKPQSIDAHRNEESKKEEEKRNLNGIEVELGKEDGQDEQKTKVERKDSFEKEESKKKEEGAQRENIDNFEVDSFEKTEKEEKTIEKIEVYQKEKDNVNQEENTEKEEEIIEKNEAVEREEGNVKAEEKTEVCSKEEDSINQDDTIVKIEKTVENASQEGQNVSEESSRVGLTNSINIEVTQTIEKLFATVLQEDTPEKIVNVSHIVEISGKFDSSVDEQDKNVKRPEEKVVVQEEIKVIETDIVESASEAQENDRPVDQQNANEAGDDHEVLFGDDGELNEEEFAALEAELMERGLLEDADLVESADVGKIDVGEPQDDEGDIVENDVEEQFYDADADERPSNAILTAPSNPEDLDDDQTLTLEVYGDDEDQPMSSQQPSEQPSTSQTTEQTEKRSVILSTHTVGNVGTDLRLTESELQLGKVKPIWIKDAEYNKCMLCLARFTLVNRRHHCRCCGRVLCSNCCQTKRILPYMVEEDENKPQRVCQPCNLTLDRIEVYEKMVESQGANAQEAEETPSGFSSQQPSASIARKKSVLKQRKPASEDEPAPEPELPKRSVRFLDGISPGTEIQQELRHQAQSEQPKKLLKKPSARKSRRKIGIDEAKHLLFHDRLLTISNDGKDEIVELKEEEIQARFSDNYSIHLLIKRNINLYTQLCNGSYGKFISIYTQGLNTLGIDEILISYDVKEETPAFPFKFTKLIAKLTDRLLDPSTHLLDDRNGIRLCALRMKALIKLDDEDKETIGTDIEAFYFASYMNQDLSGIPHPSQIFRICVFIKNSELKLFQALPTRTLFKLGMTQQVYPYPIINQIDRPPVFGSFETPEELCQSTLLSMFHDFRSYHYQLAYVPGTYVEFDSDQTNIFIPAWAKSQIQQTLDLNSNMITWSCDLNEDSIGVLACERISNQFETRIFPRSENEPENGKYAANFIAFSTGHKGTESSASLNIVEDGIVVRLTIDGFEDLKKKLESGEDYEIKTESRDIIIRWIDYTTALGQISSPVDQRDLRGYYQYGLVKDRPVQANNLFDERTYALRLASVISLTQLKMDPQLHSQFFDACERITQWLTMYIEHFFKVLLSMDIKQMAIRLHATQEKVGFELAPWLGLEEQYDSFVVMLGDKFLPFLYQMQASSLLDFAVELHLPIISVQPLQSREYYDVPTSSNAYRSDGQDSNAEVLNVNESEADSTEISDPSEASNDINDSTVPPVSLNQPE